MKNKYLLFLLLIVPNFLFAQTGVIKGQILDLISNEPIGFATVQLLGTTQGTNSDESGNYEFTGLEPKLYNLKITFVGYKDESFYEIQVTNSKPAVVNARLEQNSKAIEGVVVKASPFKKTEESPLSLRTIGIAEIQRNPGGNRDISKVVQNLPGVTSTASFRNDLIIRGGAPNENRFYLDEVEVPNINHFATQGASGGPVGLINVDFIREVDFFSGAFPSNRGNTLSSVFAFQQKDGRDDKLGFTATVGTSDYFLTLEGPLNKKKNVTFLASARRSSLQLLFKAIGLPFLPTYNDAQFKVKWKIDQKNELTFIGLGAIDQFTLNLDANKTEAQQYLLNNLPVSPQWNYTQGFVYKHYRKEGYSTAVFSRNMLDNQAYKYANNNESDPNGKILDYQSREAENKIRIEDTERFGDYKLNIGVNYEFAKYSSRTFNKINTPQGNIDVNFNSAFDLHKYGIFGQISRKWLDEKLVVSAGVRADGNSYSARMSNLLEQFSPRLSLAYSISPKLSFNMNTGIYYQLPTYTLMGFRDNNGILVNKNNLTYIRNAQFVAGLEYNISSFSKVTVEGYFKKYSNYPFLLRDSICLANLGGDFGVIGNEPANSTAGGRTYGLEVLFQQRLFKGFYGIAAYTLGWSEFEDKNKKLVSSSWDARHILSLTLGKQFKRNWEVGLNFRYQSGLPYTPFDVARSSQISVWDRTGRGLKDFNLLNSERNTASKLLNLRVDKKWFFKKWNMTVYLDIQNLLGNKVSQFELLLDRPLDATGNPIGGAVTDPSDPTRYKTKILDSGSGTRVPNLGIIIGI